MRTFRAVCANGRSLEVEVRPADAVDVSAVIDLLSEASRWLGSKGIDQWPERFDDELIAASAERGELYAAVTGNTLAGTLTLQWSDPMFWGERADAGFVHRLAVRRAYSGLGRQLIDWADHRTENHGRPFLCLDTLTANQRLRRYYEDLGFRRAGEIPGPADHPTARLPDKWTATLYERPVAVHRRFPYEEPSLR